MTRRGLLHDPGRAIDLEESRTIDTGDLILVNGPRNDAARVVNVRNSDHVSLHGISGKTDLVAFATNDNAALRGGDRSFMAMVAERRLNRDRQLLSACI